MVMPNNYFSKIFNTFLPLIHFDKLNALYKEKVLKIRLPLGLG